YYGTHCAVDDVSFTIGRGEVAALLGPNGSGKSTLMRVLAGDAPPTAGRVCIDGMDVAEQPAAARRRVSYLPEQVSLYPELTVRRFLAFVAEVKGLGARARRAAVADAIERCGLVEVADRLAGKLSKGYRQRGGLAQALVGGAAGLVRYAPAGLAGTAVALSARDPGPVQRALGAALVARGWILLEVRVSTPTLEDLFVQLVGPAGDGDGGPRGRRPSK